MNAKEILYQMGFIATGILILILFVVVANQQIKTSHTNLANKQGVMSIDYVNETVTMEYSDER